MSTETARMGLRWLGSAFASFSIGAVAGGACIPAIHYLVYADTDPLRHGWPLCLHILAFLISMIMTLLFRSAITSAVGVYAGLIVFMLSFAGAEYPASSAIALAVHGLLPATIGSTIAFCVLRASSIERKLKYERSHPTEFEAYADIVNAIHPAGFHVSGPHRYNEGDSDLERMTEEARDSLTKAA